eukprot:11315038-Alexandrium_andersonii.AAC.1
MRFFDLLLRKLLARMLAPGTARFFVPLLLKHLGRLLALGRPRASSSWLPRFREPPPAPLDAVPAMPAPLVNLTQMRTPHALMWPRIWP